MASIFQEMGKFTASIGKKVSVGFEFSLLGVIRILPSFPHTFNQNFMFGLAKDMDF